MKKLLMILAVSSLGAQAATPANTFSKDLSVPVRTDTINTIVWPYIDIGTPIPLTVHQAALTIGTTAVRLTYNGSAPPSTRVLLAAQLSSASSASCYLGSSTVTTTGSTVGVQMAAGTVFAFNNDAGDYWAICGTAGQTVYVTEQE